MKFVCPGIDLQENVTVNIIVNKLYYAGYPAVHVLSFYCDAIAGVVGRMPLGDDKANEIPVAAKVLQSTPVKGCVITGDAMSAQKSVRRAVLAQGGERVVTVKENQPGLCEAIDSAFTPAFSPLGGTETARSGDDSSRRGKGAWARGRTNPGSHGLAQRLPGLARRRTSLSNTPALSAPGKGKRGSRAKK